jgi:uncharacterized protein YjdB
MRRLTKGHPGLVRGVVLGMALGLASCDGSTTQPNAVASVEVSPSGETVIEVGHTVQLTATMKDAAGNVLTGRTVTWSSDDDSIATVSGTGLVTGEEVGSATITATSEGESGTASVMVVITQGFLLGG